MHQILLGLDPLSRAIDWLVKYTKADHMFLTALLTETAVASLLILHLPLLVSEDGSQNVSLHAICDLICSTRKGVKDILMGKEANELQAILSFLELCTSCPTDELLKIVEERLDQTRLFLVGTHISVADIFSFFILNSDLVLWEDWEKTSNPNTFRWADHILHLPYWEEYVQSLNMFISFPTNTEPPTKALLKKLIKEKWKKQLKAAKKDLPKEAKKDKKKGKQAPKEESKEESKLQPKEGGKKKEKKLKKPQPAANDLPNVSKLNIVVGRITEVVEVEESDKLYMEQVDIGNGETRTILSGLRKFVSIDEMKGANVVVLANLRPRKMLGKYSSHGMVLAAETQDKSVIELLQAPEGSEPGDKVTIDDFERAPLENLNKSSSKNEFFLEVDKFKINNDGLANYDGHILRTEKGELKSKTVKDGIIA